MVSSQIRQEARASLTGKWGKAALITLCYALITFCISWILKLIPIVGSIADAVLSIPFAYGILVSFIKLKRNEEVSYIDFLKTGFSVFGKLWGIIGHTFLKLLVPFIVLIISILLIAFGTTGGIMTAMYARDSISSTFSIFGIIGFILYVVAIVWLVVKGLLYSLTSYILFDNPDMDSKEIVEKSENLMTGNRCSYIWLGLTFIGWAILAVCTFGIGYLWLLPYIQVAMVCFYEDKAGILNNDTSNTEVVE